MKSLPIVIIAAVTAAASSPSVEITVESVETSQPQSGKCGFKLINCVALDNEYVQRTN